MQLNPSCV